MLENTYIFRWESDFFAISKSGLVHEIEVKISRSDFKADFKKVKKHQELEMAQSGMKMFTVRHRLEYEYQAESIRGTFARKNSTKDFEVPGIYKGVKLFQSVISFQNVFTPNRFYYACPEGLIEKSEVPKYAGLYYIDKWGGLKMVKQAPILHRRKFNYEPILLKKFYYLSLNQRININALRYENEKLREFEGDIVGMNENFPLQVEINFKDL